MDSPAFYSIICPHCNEGEFHRQDNKDVCKACGHVLTDDEIVAVLNRVSRELMRPCMSMSKEEAYETAKLDFEGTGFGLRKYGESVFSNDDDDNTAWLVASEHIPMKGNRVILDLLHAKGWHNADVRNHMGSRYVMLFKAYEKETSKAMF